jgi:hypothetical protein
MSEVSFAIESAGGTINTNIDRGEISSPLFVFDVDYAF